MVSSDISGIALGREMDIREHCRHQQSSSIRICACASILYTAFPKPFTQSRGRIKRLCGSTANVFRFLAKVVDAVSPASGLDVVCASVYSGSVLKKPQGQLSPKEH